MRRCCYCKRTFGPAPGIKPGETTDGICQRCWPGVCRDLGLAVQTYPGTMTEDTVDEVTYVVLCPACCATVGRYGDPAEAERARIAAEHYGLPVADQPFIADADTGEVLREVLR